MESTEILQAELKGVGRNMRIVPYPNPKVFEVVSLSVERRTRKAFIEVKRK